MASTLHTPSARQVMPHIHFTFYYAWLCKTLCFSALLWTVCSYRSFQGRIEGGLLLVSGQSMDGKCGNPLEHTNVVLVKVGGSSITHKANKETLNENALSWFADSLAKSISPFFRAPLKNDLFDPQSCPSKNCNIDLGSGTTMPSTAYVIVHGAGSFGHHSANEYGLKGQTQPPLATKCNTPERKRFIMQGLAETRLSVQKLNGAVVSTLLDHGINAIGISPCFGIPGIEAFGCVDEADKQAIQSVIYSTLRAGLVPVLHGDACLYGENDAGILSGDTIMEIIGKASWVSRALFITDVDGVFTSDPHLNPEAELIRSIAVDSLTGEILNFSFDATGSSHYHDVTGGLKTKLASAASIAATGKNVTIARFGSDCAKTALEVENGIDRATILYKLEE